MKNQENDPIGEIGTGDIPETCGGKTKPSSKPEGAGSGKYVCDGNVEWIWKEELGGV